MVDILVRNVSPEAHRALKIEAAQEGITLSEAVRRLIEAQAVKPGRPLTMEVWNELQAKWRKTLPIDPLPADFDWAKAIRDGRDELDARDGERAREWLGKEP
ncbi:MAG: hypothetical protein NBV67_14375 [Tagaea sp.]|nr:hypothetical protein [Tagaea sp.]